MDSYFFMLIRLMKGVWLIIFQQVSFKKTVCNQYGQAIVP